MVAYIKYSTNYGLFILESEAATNDDWIADHAGVIKEADWALYTEGTEGIFLPYAGKINHSPDFVMDLVDLMMGEAVDVSLGEGHDLLKIEGRYGGTSESDRNTKMANLLLLFAKHLKSSDNQLYLGYRKIGEIWEPFTNATPAIVYYLKGKLLPPSYDREEGENWYNWKIAFRGAW